jgi:hypothetical protein
MRNRRTVLSVQLARQGILLGLCGGIAEIIWIGLYGSAGAVDSAEVARAISAATGQLLLGAPLTTAPFIQGVAIHMFAALGLGIALAYLWRSLEAPASPRIGAYAFMVGALALVWAFNFFVVLPLISPAQIDLHRPFTELIPYPVSLASKILFGVVGALVLQWSDARSVPAPSRPSAC